MSTCKNEVTGQERPPVVCVHWNAAFPQHNDNKAAVTLSNHKIREAHDTVNEYAKKRKRK